MDDDIVVVNKPSGLLCVPGRVEKDSLATRCVPYSVPNTPRSAGGGLTYFRTRAQFKRGGEGALALLFAVSPCRSP